MFAQIVHDLADEYEQIQKNSDVREETAALLLASLQISKVAALLGMMLHNQGVQLSQQETQRRSMFKGDGDMGGTVDPRS